MLTRDCAFFEDPEGSTCEVGEVMMHVGLGAEQLSVVSHWRAAGASTDPRLRHVAMEDDVIIIPSG